MELDVKTRVDSWTDYWKTGALHSCTTSLGDGYEGAIGDFWHACLAEMQAGQSVLDIATGNGPLPKLIASQVEGVKVVGIDQAGLRPGWWSSTAFPNVQMIGNCSLADAAGSALGLEEGFDHVVSQFGWEYIERPQSIRDALALSAAVCTWSLVCHHSESVLARVAREEAEHLRFLTSDDGLLHAAKPLLPWFRILRVNPQQVQQSGEARAARESYNAAINQLELRIRNAAVPDILLQMRGGVHQIVMETMQTGAQDGEAKLDALCTQLQANQLRSSELVSHAMTRAAIEEVVSGLEQRVKSLEVRIEELRQAEGLLAWGIQLRLKRSDAL